MSEVETSGRTSLTEDQYNEKLNEMPNVFVDFGPHKTVHTFFDAANPRKGKLERIWHRSNGHIEYRFEKEFW